MGISMPHILVVIVLFILLFGRGKIPQLMSDLAEGIKNFKKGIKEDNDENEHGPLHAKSEPDNKHIGL